MAVTLNPTSDDDLREAIAAAIASSTPLAPVGLGTRAGIGQPVEHQTLDLAGLSGVTLYEPEELILSVRAGTPVETVTALLAARGQELPFEPPAWSAARGNASGGSIGGLVMSNTSGPRRLKVGAMRDHVLGLKGVSGRAELFKAGGRVVKNVTGYDLARGLCGSWGTLAVISEVTFKVLPKPETETTIAVAGQTPAAAIQLMTEALQEAIDVSSAAHLPADIAADLALGRTALTLLRLEGFAPSVAARLERLQRLAAPHGPLDKLEADRSRQAWSAVGNIGHRSAAPDQALWRVYVAPAAGAAVVEAIGRSLPVRAAWDWSGGLIWLWVSDRLDDLGAGPIRAAVAASGGGHATLMRGPADKRSRIDVFQPQPPALAALAARLKAQFDPAGILNPGRMTRAR